MKNDKEIKSIINSLMIECQDFLNDVENVGNQTAYSDRIVETILKKARKRKIQIK